MNWNRKELRKGAWNTVFKRLADGLRLDAETERRRNL